LDFDFNNLVRDVITSELYGVAFALGADWIFFFFISFFFFFFFGGGGGGGGERNRRCRENCKINELRSGGADYCAGGHT
jgi:hypothetical protein